MIKYIIRSSRLILPVLFLLLFIAGTAGAKVTLGDVLGSVVKNHENYTHGLSVPYQREIITRSMALIGNDITSDVATGTFYFMQPHFLKVHQVDPDEEYVIYNGKTIWWYIPEKKIVHKYDGQHLGREMAALCKIFMGFKNPHEDFNITMTRSKDGKEFLLNLVPKKPWEDIDHLVVSVSKNDYRITRIEIHNMAGSITRFKLGKFKGRSDINEDFFNFTPPKGVKISTE